MKVFFATVSLLFLLCVVSTLPVTAQETPKTPNGQSNEQLLKEILAELKTLRSTLAKTNLNQLRFQTTFEQYKSQQNRVDSMSREIDSLKSQLIAASPFRANGEEVVKASEERLQEATDPRMRQTFERQIQSAKRNLEAQDQREKKMKERQSNLEIQLPVEQAKLDQLSFEVERIKQDINALLNQ